MFQNLLKKLRAKREEKKDIEKFLCQLTNIEKCKRITWWGFIKSFFKDTKENRILKKIDDYTWKDWIENQENKESYIVRLKKLKENDRM
jgi:hypothetical protein